MRWYLLGVTDKVKYLLRIAQSLIYSLIVQHPEGCFCLIKQRGGPESPGLTMSPSAPYNLFIPNKRSTWLLKNIYLKRQSSQRAANWDYIATSRKLIKPGTGHLWITVNSIKLKCFLLSLKKLPFPAHYLSISQSATVREHTYTHVYNNPTPVVHGLTLSV